MCVVGPAGRSTVMVCITYRAATDRIDSSDAAAPRAVQRIRCLGNCGRGLIARVSPINFREELP